MPFDWRFFTEGVPFTGSIRVCHRGPKIPVEVDMSQQFTTLEDIEPLRSRVLNSVTTTQNSAVRAREVVLRVMHSNLGPIFTPLRNIQSELEVVICEKRSSIIIDKELAPWNSSFKAGLLSLENHGIPKSTIELILQALLSQSAPYRVAARCAIILLSALVEGV